MFDIFRTVTCIDTDVSFTVLPDNRTKCSHLFHRSLFIVCWFVHHCVVCSCCCVCLHWHILQWFAVVVVIVAVAFSVVPLARYTFAFLSCAFLNTHLFNSCFRFPFLFLSKVSPLHPARTDSRGFHIRTATSRCI